MAKPNYYEILALQQDEASLSPEQVKKAYRKALLSHHPDKTTNKSGATTEPSSRCHTVTVDEIALAYKTLSEPSLKAEYDRWLASNRPTNGSNKADDRIHHTGLETVDLDDLAFEEQTQSWTRSCRCGVGDMS